MSLLRRVALGMTLGTALALFLAGCGGGGAVSSSIPSNPGSVGTAPFAPLVAGDPLGISSNNTELLQVLYADAGVTLQSAARAPQSLTPQGLTPQSSSSFSAQIVAGTATIARTSSPTAITPSTGFLMSYRDSTGSCQCNDTGAKANLPNPPGAKIAAGGWNGGSVYNTVAAATVVLIPFRTGAAPVTGPYTYTIGPWKNNASTVTATSASINTATTLGRQSAPIATVNPDHSVTVTWTALPGAVEYFLNFLTTYGTGHTHVSGVAITPHTSITIAASNLYPNTAYQVMLIDSDHQWLNVVIDTTTGQPSAVQNPLSPPFPQQVDWSVAPLATFHT